MPRYKLTDTNGKSFTYNSDVELETLSDEEREKRVNRARLEASLFNKQLEPKVNKLETVKDPIKEARAPAYIGAGTVAGAASPIIAGALAGSPVGLPGIAAGAASGAAMSFLPFLLEKLKGNEYEPTTGDIMINTIPAPFVDKGKMIPRGAGLLGGITNRLRGVTTGAGLGAVEGGATGVATNAIDAATGEADFSPLQAGKQGVAIGGLIGGALGPGRVQSKKEKRIEDVADLATQEAKLNETKQARGVKEDEWTVKNRATIAEIDTKIASLEVQEEALKSRIKKMRSLGSDRIPQLDDKAIALETQLETTQQRISELEVTKNKLASDVESKREIVTQREEELGDIEKDIGRTGEKLVKAKTTSQVPSNRTLQEEVSYIKKLNLDNLLGDSERKDYFKDLQAKTKNEEASVAKFRNELQKEMGNSQEFNRLMQGRIDERVSNKAKLEEGELSAQRVNYETKMKPLKTQLEKDKDILALAERDLGGVNAEYEANMKDLLKTSTALEVLRKKKDRTGNWDKKVAELEERQTELRTQVKQSKNQKSYLNEDKKKELAEFDKELAELTSHVKGLQEKLKTHDPNLGLVNRKLWFIDLMSRSIPGANQFSNAVKLFTVAHDIGPEAARTTSKPWLSPLMRKAEKLSKQLILEQDPIRDEENSSDLIEKGNIDLTKRPVVRNKDGSTSTVRSMSFEDNGREVLIPTVSDDGRIMSDEEAIENYYKTKKHLGIFRTPKAATEYAERLHNDYAKGRIKGYSAVE